MPTTDEIDAVAEAFARSQTLRREARERRIELAAARSALQRKLEELRAEVDRAKAIRGEIAAALRGYSRQPTRILG